jgi:Tol biopolymer transport system component
MSRGVRNLWRIDVDPATLRWVAGPVRLTTGAGADVLGSVAPGGDKLAFMTGSETSRLWSLPFDAKTRRATGDATPITPANQSALGFDLSADDKTLVYVAARQGRTGMQLWSISLDAGQPVLLGEALQFFSPRVSRTAPVSPRGSCARAWKGGGSRG